MRYPLKLMVMEQLNQQQKEQLRTWIYIAFSGNKISFIFFGITSISGQALAQLLA